jgi:hypothetical protein
MKPLPDLASAESDLLARLRTCVGAIQQIVTADVTDIPAGVALLRLVRSEAYEDINQLQHEALLLEAAVRLRTLHPELSAMTWFWNPANTGTGEEPDLRVMRGKEIIVSVEATASERSIGSISVHLRKTLSKLQAMAGRRFYFVRTQDMLKAAEKQIRKFNHAITPLPL